MEVTKPAISDLAPEDKWILSAVNTLTKDVTENMDKFELGIAVQKVYDFIWDEFCDWYIELSKPRLAAGGQDRAACQRNLVFVLDTALRFAASCDAFCNRADLSRYARRKRLSLFDDGGLARRRRISSLY